MRVAILSSIAWRTPPRQYGPWEQVAFYLTEGLVEKGVDVTDGKDFPFERRSQDYLLFFGRIHPDKGTLEAIQIARESGKVLLIAGLIQDDAYFEQKIKPCIDERSVFYIGNVGPSERKTLLGKALALLHPIQVDEPFGLSVAESMFCGTPVIAFNRGSMCELIVDGKTGFLVHTIGEAVQAVKQVAQLDRQECRQWAKAMFSKEKMVDNYMSVYEEILR